MATGGIFVTLYDEETLKLYLKQGVYGQHMTPQEGEPSPHSAHYRTLADYGAVRDGYHVFFFLDRKVYYGGQIVGSDDHGAFHLNGQMSPMGREADAPLVWDESQREVYEATDEPGVFRTDDEDDGTCQPFLIRFEDEMGMAGNYVTADRFYFELGEYPYLLPSNSTADADFYTLTPGETDVLINLLKNDPDGRVVARSDEDVYLDGELVAFSPEYGIDSADEAESKPHLAAAVVSNPSLLPPRLRPDSDAICHRVPVSPFKPSNVDRADAGYFAASAPIRDGTVPNVILELEADEAGEETARRVVRCLDWLRRYLGNSAESIDVYVYASVYARTFWDSVPDEYESQVEVVAFAER